MSRKKMLKIEENETKYLKREDLLQIELIMEQKEVKHQEIKNATISTLNINLRIANLKHELEKLENILIKAKENKNKCISNFNTKGKEYNDLIVDIAELYKIKDPKWGFDPETGEIKLG
jgi:hypothetical protein